jgi:hypothetical protein
MDIGASNSVPAFLQAIGVIAVYSLIKDGLPRLLGKNGKANKVVACPIVEAGKTPMTKEDHDALDAMRNELVDTKLDHIKETVERIEGHLNGD